MTFINQALAFGAAAFVVPLAIHILNRSRFRTVQWGAMHLLDSVIKVNHKRFRLEQLILLLIRCAVPILLALCLARPVLTGTNILEGDAPVSMVVLLDTSYSMDTVTDAGSRLRSAIDATREIINATGRGSEIYVLQTGGTPTSLIDRPSSDADFVIRRLMQVRGGLGASNMQAALDEALATLAGMSNARRELVVISDFQPADWDEVGLNANSIRQQCDAMEIPPYLTLLPVGQPVRKNVSVESLDYPGRALGVGQQLMVRANLRNHSDLPEENVRVVMRIDGTEFATSQLALAAYGTTQVLFPCEFDSAGSHVMEVEVLIEDSLPADNRQAAAITVWNRVGVLLVDGDPNAQPLQSETSFLSVALTPFAFSRVRFSDLIETQVVSPDALEENSLNLARVVVLANVARLDDRRVELLTRYVQNGGALLIFAGNRIDLNWYSEKLFAGGMGLLPATFGPPRGKIDGQGRSERIATSRFDHPALDLFNDAANGDLSTAEIRQWYELQVEQQTDVESDASLNDSTKTFLDRDSQSVVMLRLESGAPLLIEKVFGEGVVVQMATSCDADWSDLQMRPIYVPLMQQLVTTLASRISPPQNIGTGEPAVVFLHPEDLQVAVSSDGAAEAPGSLEVRADEPVILSLVTPDGARKTLQTVVEDSRQVARYFATQRPGVYTMTLPSAKPLHFVAETSRLESDPALLSETQLNELADNLNARIVPSVDTYLEQEHLRRHGFEIWKYVLAVLLGFMFVEVVLQQRFARVPV